jgi:SprA-related family
MTDGAVLSTIVQTAGKPFPAVAPRARAESGPAPTDATAAPRGNERGKTDAPALLRRTPLLNTENQLAAQQAGDQGDTTSGGPADKSGEKGAVNDASNPENLTDEERKKVEDLKQRDREVRAHEQAHKAAGGALTGSPTFKTERGPDGKSYAVSGEVKIDASPVPNNPEATIRKLEQVKRAALAPANPSGQDRQVAAAAEAKIQQAHQEKREKEAEALKQANEKSGGQAGDPATPDPSAESNPQAPHSNTPAASGGSAPRVSPGSLFDLVA